MSISGNIKKLRRKYNLTQDELGEIAGVSGGAVSTWERGTAEPRMGAIQKMSDYFRISKSEIVDDLDIVTSTKSLPSYDNIFPIEKKKIPMLGEIACGEPIFANEDRESYVLVGTDINADFCLKAKGDSMIGARILDGDIVFIREQTIVDDGEIAAVIIDDEATLKRVYYEKEKNRLTLQAENPKYRPLSYEGEELDHIRILGKAVAFQSDII